jgi:hypothetical protein
MSFPIIAAPSPIFTGGRTGLGQAIALALAETGADIIGLGSKAMADTRTEVARIGRKFQELRCDLSRSMLSGCSCTDLSFNQMKGLATCPWILRRVQSEDAGSRLRPRVPHAYPWGSTLRSGTNRRNASHKD